MAASASRWIDRLAPTLPHILGHIVSTVTIELGLGVVTWFGHVALEPGFVRTVLIGIDEWAMLGVSAWLVRNLAIHLWNNRERLGGGAHVVLA